MSNPTFKDCLGQDVSVGDICVAFIGEMNRNSVKQVIFLITKVIIIPLSYPRKEPLIRFEAESISEKYQWYSDSGPFKWLLINPMFYLTNNDVLNILEKKKEMKL